MDDDAGLLRDLEKAWASADTDGQWRIAAFGGAVSFITATGLVPIAQHKGE